MTFTPLSEGTVLREQDGSYKIIRLLDHGGQGAIYLAENILKNKKVAIKQSFHNNRQDLSEAFRREAQLLAQLKHSAFPEVTDHFNERGSQFLVMEYVEGNDLSSGFDKFGKCRPLSFVEVMDIAEQLLSALEYLHDFNIFHRDLKPANLMMLNDGSLKVLDLGAAKGSIGNMTERDDSVPVCTRAYAPPEQLDNLGTDRKSDIFSAAATLYHLLAGQRPPNVRQRRDAINKNLSDPLRLVNDFNPQVPLYVAQVLQQAMALDPEERPSTIARMRRMLARATKLQTGNVQTDNDESFYTKTTIPDNHQTESTKTRRKKTDEETETVVVEDFSSDKKFKIVEPPSEILMPSGHQYLGKGENEETHLFFRERDGQIVILLPAIGDAFSPFFIDKYPITNEQYTQFLNDPEICERTCLIQENGYLTVAVAEEAEVLLGDADSYWSAQDLPGTAWGVTFSDGRWQPVMGSEKFPVTLITGLGASWYAVWARQMPLENSPKGAGLPTKAEWLAAACWDFDAKNLRLFPWGDEWNVSKLNNLGYWAGHDLEKNEPEHTKYLRKARPTPIGLLTQGTSPSGMMDAFGNVWEWLTEQDSSGRRMIIGGAYTSRKSAFLNSDFYFRQDRFVGESIGFRCCWRQ